MQELTQGLAMQSPRTAPCILVGPKRRRGRSKGGPLLPLKNPSERRTANFSAKILIRDVVSGEWPRAAQACGSQPCLGPSRLNFLFVMR